MESSDEQIRSSDRDNLSGIRALYVAWKPFVWFFGGSVVFLVGKFGGQVISPDDRITKIEHDHQALIPSVSRVEARVGELSDLICLYVIQDGNGKEDSRYIRQRCNTLMNSTVPDNVRTWP